MPKRTLISRSTDRYIVPVDFQQLDNNIREEPRQPPTVGIFDAPVRCYILNIEWDAHIAGAISALTEWRTWIDDEDERSFAVQQVLKLLSNESGCDMTFQLRQNPDNPCQLQQSFNGVDWSLAYDYSLCAPQLNIDDVQNQLDKLIELYDLLSGDVSALYENLVYDSTSEDDVRDLALCAGISAFVDFVCELVLSEREEDAVYARIGAVILAITSAVLIASGIGSPLGLAIATALVGGYAVIWDGISDIVLSNQDARDAVACCMYESLSGATLSKTLFEDSLDGCAFTALTPEAQIAGAIAPMLDEEDIFTAFLEFVDEKFRPAQLGLVDCNLCSIYPLCIDFTDLSNINIEFGTVNSGFGNPSPALSGVISGDIGVAPWNAVDYPYDYQRLSAISHTFDSPQTVSLIEFDFYSSVNSSGTAFGFANCLIILTDESDVELYRNQQDRTSPSTWSTHTRNPNVANVKNVYIMVTINKDSTPITGNLHLDNVCIDVE